MVWEDGDPCSGPCFNKEVLLGVLDSLLLPIFYPMLPSIRLLKINSLFLVQNFPKLNVRMRRENKQEKTRNTMVIQSIGLFQVLGGNKTMYRNKKAKMCTLCYSGTSFVIKK